MIGAIVSLKNTSMNPVYGWMAPKWQQSGSIIYGGRGGGSFRVVSKDFLICVWQPMTNDSKCYQQCLNCESCLLLIIEQSCFALLKSCCTGKVESGKWDQISHSWLPANTIYIVFNKHDRTLNPILIWIPHKTQTLVKVAQCSINNYRESVELAMSQ